MIFPNKIYLAVEDIDRKGGRICNVQFKENVIKASTLKSLYSQDILDCLFSQIAFGNTHKSISVNNLSRMKIIMPDKSTTDTITSIKKKPCFILFLLLMLQIYL